MRSVVPFAFLALAGCGVTPTVGQPPPIAANEASLRAADELQRAAVAAGVVQAIRALMHTRRRVNAPTNRVMTREEILAMFEGGAITAEPVHRTVEETVVSGTTGLVMGRETLAPRPGNPLARAFGGRTLLRRFTNVYSFENGRWWFLARHFTQAPQSRDVHFGWKANTSSLRLQQFVNGGSR